MSYGVTPQGFISKRLDDIKTELEDAFKQKFGISIDLDPDAPFGQIIGIISERESEVWEMSEGVYNSQYPNTAEGINLDNVASITGVTRNAATKSTVLLKLFGTQGTVVPTGSIVSKLNDELTRFLTDTDAIIGPGISEVQKLTFGADPDGGSFEVNFGLDTSAAILHSDNAAAVLAKIEAMPSIGIGNITVTGSIDDITGLTISFINALSEQALSLITITNNTLVDGVTPVTITPSALVEGSLPFIEVEASSEDPGEFSGPSGSLLIIETSIAGWDTVTNELDAVVGREVESDADLKIRRENSLQVAGSGTTDAIRSQLLQVDEVTAALVFENVGITPDLEGRPAKSFEAVVQGGDETEIANVILLTKPAGIETFGDILKTVQDSQGFDVDINFSRPTDVPMWLEVDLATDPELYPTDGDAQAAAALLAFGNGLGIGQDVIVYPQLICSLNAIPGITDITIRLGLAALPTLDNNITILPSEISKWDSSRIAVVSV